MRDATEQELTSFGGKLDLLPVVVEPVIFPGLRGVAAPTAARSTAQPVRRQPLAVPASTGYGQLRFSVEAQAGCRMCESGLRAGIRSPMRQERRANRSCTTSVPLWEPCLSPSSTFQSSSQCWAPSVLSAHSSSSPPSSPSTSSSTAAVGRRLRREGTVASPSTRPGSGTVSSGRGARAPAGRPAPRARAIGDERAAEFAGAARGREEQAGGLPRMCEPGGLRRLGQLPARSVCSSASRSKSGQSSLRTTSRARAACHSR